MNTSSLRRRSAGFTLIELLTVVAIIIILMALTLTATRSMGEVAKRSQANNTARSVVFAVKSYYVDYGAMPPFVDVKPKEDDLVFGEPVMSAIGPNNELFYTLRNIPGGPNRDFAANPRRTVYFEDHTARVNAQNEPRAGFYDQTITGGIPSALQQSCLYDPWGHQYGIIVDANGDNRIDLKDVYYDFGGVQDHGGHAPRWTVGVFSMGKDGKLGTDGDRIYRRSSTERSDDQISWE